MFDSTVPLAEAQTIPSDWYLEPTYFKSEQTKLFQRAWVPLARSEDIPEPGFYVTRSLAGEQILLLRNEAKKVKAFSRVCRHRAGSIGRDEGGCAKRLQCQYHGWHYDLGGHLLNAPEFEGVKNFDKREIRLPEFLLEEWNGFLFVSLNPDPPSFSSWIGEMHEEVAEAGYDLSNYRQIFRRDYTLNCNWKVYVDNYLEGYHIPIAHPALMGELDYKQYSVQTRRFHSFQNAPIRAQRGGAAKKRAYGKPGQAQRTLYYWLFPGFMLNIYPDNMSANYVVPLGHDKTLTIFEWYLPEKKAKKITKARMEKLTAFSHQVQIEDIKLCEDVQRNITSSTYQRGRYSVKRENGVHHFHQLVAEFLNE